MSDPSKESSDATTQNQEVDDGYTRDPEIVEEISLEDYQPKGTLTLTILYFIILSLMWVFMYFVEFAGKGPSIID